MEHAPVGVWNHTGCPVPAHKLVLSRVIDVLQAQPEILRLRLDLLSQQTTDEGLLEPVEGSGK